MNEREMTLAAIFNVFTSWSWVDHFEGGTLGELMSKAGSAADSGEYAVRQASSLRSHSSYGRSHLTGRRHVRIRNLRPGHIPDFLSLLP